MVMRVRATSDGESRQSHSCFQCSRRWSKYWIGVKNRKTLWRKLGPKLLSAWARLVQWMTWRIRAHRFILCCRIYLRENRSWFWGIQKRPMDSRPGDVSIADTIPLLVPRNQHSWGTFWIQENASLRNSVKGLKDGWNLWTATRAERTAQETDRA